MELPFSPERAAAPVEVAARLTAAYDRCQAALERAGRFLADVGRPPLDTVGTPPATRPAGPPADPS